MPIHGTVLFPAETVLTSTQPNVVSVATADLDGDGYRDVVVSSNNPEKVVWYRNNGDGTFGTTQYVISTFSGVSVGNVAVGDLDGDGRVDVAYWSGDQRIKWSRNGGGALSTGLFAYDAGNPAANQTLISGTAVDSENSVSIGDVNADGLPDVISAAVFKTGASEETNNIVAWYQNLGGGSFGWNSDAPLANRKILPTAVNGLRRVSPTSARPVDLDADGVMDFAITFRNTGKIGWIKGSGSPTNPTFTYLEFTGTFSGAIATTNGDFDGDGWQDLVLGAPGVSNLSQFRNQTHDPAPVSPFFGAAQTIAGSISGAYSLASSDLNSDGKADIVVVAAGGNRVYWYENLGSGIFTQRTISTLVNFPISVAVADFNLDGVPDVLSGSNGSGKVAAYINQGGQTALATVSTAPATLREGWRDAALRVAVSNRGVSGDNNAQLFTLGLLLEKSAGVPLTTAEANLLLDNLAVYLDTNSSGLFEPASDTLVGKVDNLALTSGVLAFPFSPVSPSSIQIPPASTRNYFVVAKIAATASSQAANTFRITHLSKGTGRTVLRDATTTALLTTELSGNTNTASTLVTALAGPTYTDWSYLSFDAVGATNTLQVDDFDSDGTANLFEFAFGTDPTISQSNAITLAAGVITQHGAPTTLATNTGTSVNFQALFGRRKSYLDAGLTYTVQFSADLTTWVSSATVPTVLADDGSIEAVAVPYPFFVNGRKTRFFRVMVTAP